MPPHRASPWAAFRHRDYRLLQSARIAQILGIQMQSVAVGLQVNALTHNAFDLGMVGLMQFLPFLALSLVAGHVADRFDRRLVLAACHGSIALISGALMLNARAGGTSVAPSGQLGPLIVLAAGEPTAIAVTNHLMEPTAVHWHGIEVQHSEDDGSMMIMNDTMAGSMGASAIAPGSTFVAQFTPPRAGTFMYHTHYDGVWQLVGGLAGPLVVLPRGQTYDPATDHIVMLTDDAANIGTKSRVNGERTPRPLVMHRSVAQRLRLINMTSTNPDLSIAIEGDPQATWLPIAADGVDFPAALRVPVKPIRRLTIGETRDFLFAPTTVGPLKINVYENGLLLASQTVIVQP